MKKTFYNSILIIFMFIAISGCVSRGDVNKPLTPIGASQVEQRDSAFVTLYRSDDTFGLLQIGTYGVVVADPDGFDEKYDQDYTRIIIADRSIYSSIKLKPGTYNFRFRGLSAQVSHDFSSQIAKLDAGKNYYLAVSFTVGGAAGLEFRDKQDFENATVNAKRATKISGFDFVDGFKYDILGD